MLGSRWSFSRGGSGTDSATKAVRGESEAKSEAWKSGGERGRFHFRTFTRSRKSRDGIYDK